MRKLFRQEARITGINRPIDQSILTFILFIKFMRKPVVAAIAVLSIGIASSAFMPANNALERNNPVQSAFMSGISGTLQSDPTQWKADVSHSSVKFTVTHLLVSEVDGYFKMFNGTMEHTKEDFSDATINFTLDATSVTTHNDSRDKHLQAKDFFDTQNFPKITFASKSFTPAGGNKYKLVGDLTLKGVTKTLSFDVSYTGKNEGPRGVRTGFKAKSTIDRNDFAITGGGVAVSDEVEIVVTLAMTKVQ